MDISLIENLFYDLYGTRATSNCFFDYLWDLDYII